jgi:type III pantothenate kinase
VAIQRPPHVIGKNTEEAMQAGVFWGYIDLIDGLVDRIKDEYGKPMTVIATGGVASLFQGAANKIDHFDSDITIKGLRILYERNITNAAKELK